MTWVTSQEFTRAVHRLGLYPREAKTGVLDAGTKWGLKHRVFEMSGQVVAEVIDDQVNPKSHYIIESNLPDGRTLSRLIECPCEKVWRKA